MRTKISDENGAAAIATMNAGGQLHFRLAPRPGQVAILASDEKRVVSGGQSVPESSQTRLLRRRGVSTGKRR